MSGSPVHYSCLENSMDRAYSPYGCKESNTTERLSLSQNDKTQYYVVFIFMKIDIMDTKYALYALKKW